MSHDHDAEVALEQLKQRLSDPQTVRSLNLLLDNVEHLATMAMLFGSAMSRGDELMANLATSIDEAKKGFDPSDLPVDPKEFAESGKSFLKAIPAAKPLVDKAVDNGVLDSLGTSTMFNPEVIDVLNILTKSLSVAAIEASEEEQLLSPWRLLWRLRDKNINRALRFAITTALSMGRELDPRTGNFRRRPAKPSKPHSKEK